jgi:hypothetical protein
VALDVFQNLKAVLSRHMKVEKQQVRGLALHRRDCLVAVMYSFEVVHDTRPLHGDPDEAGKGTIVFSEHNAGRSSASVIRNHVKSSPRGRVPGLREAL